MTIKDISAQTGYSVGTISRVLNNQPNVSEKARKVILEAARATGFQLNTNAKQLKQQHSNSILVLVKGNSNQLFGELVEALQLRMSDAAQPLTVDYLDEDRNEVRRALQLCLEKKPRGILFLGGNRQNFLADFDKIGVPCLLVTADAAGMPFENLSSVSSDDRFASRMAMDALISQGHRRFAIIRFSYEGGYQAACNLLDRGRDFTALFAMSDVMAIGAIRALNDRGIHVPEHVSVMGFDGLQVGEFIQPRLSTVCQDPQELAARSVDILLENIKNPQSPRYETVPVQIQLRESTKHV